MKKSLLIIITALLCRLSFSQSGLTVYDSIISSGIYRKYNVYIPANYNAVNAVPLVLNLHGYTSNATQQALYSNFMLIADTAGFIVAHPEGTKSNGQQYWNAGFGGPANDVQFMSDLIDSLKLMYNINLDRVYSCGMSNGGIMSYYLALKLPSRIAAVASVTGSMLNSWFALNPVPPRAVPVMEIHGTNDATVPYNGDGTFSNIDSVIKKWRLYNNCSPTTFSYNVPNTSTSDNSNAVHFKYLNGTNGSSVELFKVINGSHSWPGASAFIPNTNQDFKASIEIWRFFSQYKTSQFFTPQNLGMYHQTIVDVYPNPANDIITVQSEQPVEKLVLYDVAGKKIMREEYASQLNIELLNAGIYLLEITSGNSRFYKKIQKVNY